MVLSLTVHVNQDLHIVQVKINLVKKRNSPEYYRGHDLGPLQKKKNPTALDTIFLFTAFSFSMFAYLQEDSLKGFYLCISVCIFVWLCTIHTIVTLFMNCCFPDPSKLTLTPE